MDTPRRKPDYSEKDERSRSRPANAAFNKRAPKRVDSRTKFDKWLDERVGKRVVITLSEPIQITRHRIVVTMLTVDRYMLEVDVLTNQSDEKTRCWISKTNILAVQEDDGEDQPVRKAPAPNTHSITGSEK